MTEFPAGFAAHVANIGIKDDTTDFLVVAADRPVSAAAVFTRSRFAGHSVTLSRQHVADGRLQAIVVISKNANVANGEQGDQDAAEIVARVAGSLGCAPTDVLLASTGVIGRPYPMDRVRSHLAELPLSFSGRDADAAARAIMTTDTVPKLATASCGSTTIVGFAKGVGMIEPNMATMLAFVFTDADVAPTELDRVFRRVCDRTFNALSVDTDTSTSDTAVVMASGVAGPVAIDEFERALEAVCLELTQKLARDGEGATKLLVVTVGGGSDDAQAKRVAKAILNSPLVKTAVHGADPNWGRVAMAIGKCEDDTDIEPARTSICFGDQEVYPAFADADALEQLAAYMRRDEVHIRVELGLGSGSATVYGCDLSDGYVRINADYTT